MKNNNKSDRKRWNIERGRRGEISYVPTTKLKMNDIFD